MAHNAADGPQDALTTAPMSLTSPQQSALTTTGVAVSSLPVFGNTVAVAPVPLEPAVSAEDEKRDAQHHKETSTPSSQQDGTVVDTEEDPEMAGLTNEQRRVVQEAVFLGKSKPVGFFALFRFHTGAELALNAVGILFAIIAGSAQPLMTIVFGALTTQFTNYGLAVQNAALSPEGAANLELAKQNLLSELNKDVLYLVYIGIGQFVATFIYMATFIRTGERGTRRIREKYLRSVLRQNIGLHDKLGPGAVTTKIETDTALIQASISEKVSMSCMYIAMFFSGIVIAFIINWRLAGVIFVIVPCIAIAGVTMDTFLAKYKRQMLEQTALGSTLAEEVISSVRNTHAFGTQHKLAALYDVPNQVALGLGLKTAFATGLGMAVFFFIIYGSYALAWHWGTTLILRGQATSGNVITCFFSVVIGAFSLAELTPNMQAIANGMGAASSIFTIIDRVPVIDSASEDGLKPEKCEGVIDIDKVAFIYPSRPAVQVLYEFQGKFPAGKMTALVGGSGSGKSTIIGLIERFYDPVGGSIRLDGVELKDLNVRWLRSQIGLVSQEPTLFATTVAGNIEHGLIGTSFENESPEQRRARVIEAAVQANADGFIRGLPEGYDTKIGERGMLLSGGQKQRIAIARAIIGDPQILLLDEATSALDTASEVIVQDALDKAAAGRTTVVVAHRLSTIKNADQIIVLTAGRILESAMTNESGSAHQNLLRNPDGAYSRLVGAQKFREQDDSDDESISDEKAPPQLTRQQLDDMAQNEKPQFETLKRTGTGRSAASEALEQRRQQDLEAGAGKAKSYSFSYLIKRMLLLNIEHRNKYVIAVVGSIISGCVYPVFAIVFGGIINVFALDPVTQRDQLRSGGDRYATYAVAIAIVATFGMTVQCYYFSGTVEYLARTIRVKTFAAILRQDIAYFDKEENSTGHLTAQVSDLAQKVAGLFGMTGGVILQNTVTLFAGAIVGLVYGWRIALVGIACMPLTISAGIIRLKVVVLKDENNKKSYAQSAQMACEAAAAIRTVAALTREKDCSDIYSSYLDEPQRLSDRSAVFSNGLYSFSQALSLWVIALIFWYGAGQLVAGNIDAGGFFVCLTAVIFASIEAGNVFSYVPSMSGAKGASAEVVRLLDARPEIDAEEPTGKPFASSNGHIKFDNVHFRYPTRPHVRVLRGLDIEVKPGEFAAIVGPSGCGKSTLIQLVQRFYDPLSGSVLVDGEDISELNINDYRKNVGLISQEPTLYAGSVRFNITLGALKPAEQVAQEEVEQACREANIHDFVMSLPDGYDTEVGGKGTQLSGGQKQRIAIARALIRQPKILLLDEATSALDSESERVVQAALDKAAKGRSTIAVAHRLSTIQSADVIYVLRDGKVAEKGKHFELLAKKGIYAELVEAQMLEKTA